MNKCPECGGYQLDHNPEGISCRNCGLILDDAPIDQTLFTPKSITNNAGYSGYDLEATMPQSGKLTSYSWLLSTKEKNTYNARRKLELIASRQRLPKVVEDEAYMIFRRAVDNGLNIGRSNTNLIYGAVYASCIIHGIPKTPLELIAYTEVNRNGMLNAYRFLKKKLNLDVPFVDPLDFVHRFGSRVKLKQSTISLASQIIIKLKKTNVLSGKHPKTIVASALYIASKMNNDHRSQREIANATGVLEVTIRKRSREISEFV